MSARQTCRAAVIVGYREPLQLWEIAIPDPEPGAMVVKTEAATVCGTDVHLWHGRLTQYAKLPAIPGHEMTGRIVKLGSGVSRDAAGAALKEGDRIVWTQAWCGNCYFCAIAQQPTLCREVASLYGFGPADRPPALTGGMAEFIYVRPQSRVIKVPLTLDAAVVSSATCALRTVVHAFDRFGGLGMQEDVAILGSGPIGLYALALAISSGAGRTIMIGAPQARLDLALRWGADQVIDIEKVSRAEDRKEMVWAWTDGKGPDIVIECAGPGQAFEDGFNLIRDGGRYLVIGQTDPQPSRLLASRVNLRQVDILGSFSATARHYYKAIRFLQSAGKRFSFEDLVTRRFSLDQAEQALNAMASMEDIKPAVLFQ